MNSEVGGLISGVLSKIRALCSQSAMPILANRCCLICGIKDLPFEALNSSCPPVRKPTGISKPAGLSFCPPHRTGPASLRPRASLMTISGSTVNLVVRSDPTQVHHNADRHDH